MGKTGSLFALARKKDNREFVEKTLSRRSSKRRGKTTSPDLFTDENEAERINDDYIKDKYKNSIIDRRTAREAMNSLLIEPKTGLISDFYNLIKGVGVDGRRTFIDFLFNKYAQPKIDIVNSSSVTLRSGRVRPGLKVNSRVYLIVVGEGIYARSFKTGRFVSFKKHYLEVFR